MKPERKKALKVTAIIIAIILCAVALWCAINLVSGRSFAKLLTEEEISVLYERYGSGEGAFDVLEEAVHLDENQILKLSRLLEKTTFRKNNKNSWAMESDIPQNYFYLRCKSTSGNNIINIQAIEDYISFAVFDENDKNYKVYDLIALSSTWRDDFRACFE